MPGASPDTMATSVATPLERHLGVIADVTEMTSQSSVGSARITLQFGLNRDIDGAARDVQAAINASRADLPTSLRSNPTYHKVNPADAPILILALSSPTRTAGSLYDSAATVLQQTLSTVPGVGEVDVSGSANPAVRVELEPNALFHYGIGLEDVRAALASANANSPKGAIEFNGTQFPAGSRVVSDLDLHYARLGWIWQPWLIPERLRLGPVLEAKAFLAEMTLEAPALVPRLKETEHVSVVIPTVGLAADVHGALHHPLLDLGQKS